MKKLNAIYTMHTLDGFAGSLISVFIPSYMLKLGYSLSQVLIYFIFYSAAILIFFFVAAYFTNRYGFRPLLILRLPFLLAYLAILYHLENFHASIYPLAALNALNIGFYWFALHIYFIQHSSHDTMGNDTGKLNAIPKFFSIFAPLLGGFITVFLGFKALFAFSFVIYLSSAFTLLSIGNHKTNTKLNIKKLLAYFRKYPKYFRAEFFKNISDDAESIIWPIFIYLSFHNFLTLGALNTVLALAASIFSYIVGKTADRADRKKILKWGAVLMILVWLGRFLFHDHVSVYLLTVMAGFFSILIAISFSSIFYGLAKKEENSEEFILFSEFAVNAGRVLLYSVCLLFVTQIKLSFLITATSYVYFFFF